MANTNAELIRAVSITLVSIDTKVIIIEHSQDWLCHKIQYVEAGLQPGSLSPPK